jgi:hypothetical protein
MSWRGRLGRQSVGWVEVESCKRGRVQIVATACPPRASRPMRARLSAVFFMTDNLLARVGVTDAIAVLPSKSSDVSTLLGKKHHLLFKV